MSTQIDDHALGAIMRARRIALGIDIQECADRIKPGWGYMPHALRNAELRMPITSDLYDPWFRALGVDRAHVIALATVEKEAQ
jgi:hypothetical protein